MFLNLIILFCNCFKMFGKTYVPLSLPHPLKMVLSEHWVQCFEMLNQQTIPLHSIQRRIHNVLSSRHSRQTTESWDQLVTSLSVEDAVVDQGAIKLQPVFFSLPNIAQVRLLSLIEKNASMINSDHLQQFISKLEKGQSSQNQCLRDSVARLRSLIDDEKEGKAVESKLFPFGFNPAYERLFGEIDQPSGDREACLSPIIQNQRTELDCVGQKVVDVIIINDEESLDLSDTEGDVIDLSSPPIPAWNKPAASSLGYYQNRSEANTNPSHNKSNEVPIHNPGHDKCNANSSQDKSNAYPNLNQDESNLSKCVTASSSIHEENNLYKRKNTETVVEPKMKARKIQQENVSSSTNDVSQESSKSVEPCLGEVLMGELQKIKESFSLAGNCAELSSDKLNCLIDLSEFQMKEACSVLQLSDQSEQSLVSVCDKLPWSQLKPSVAAHLVSACFYTKLISLENEASQTLLAAILSACEDQPAAVLELLVKVIQHAHPNDYHCQLLAVLCKKVQSSEWIANVVRQLCDSPALKVSESMCPVLQAILDTGSDLQPLTLTSLLRLMSKGGQEMATSGKFGKCLMACLSKWGKKMSSESLSVAATLVDTHCSGLKPALKAAFKRLNK